MKLSAIDRAIIQFDRTLKTLTGGASEAARPSPAAECSDTDLSQQEKKHSAGLMRVNHAGEVCAQALYQGQAATAKLKHVRHKMDQAAAEELDHLAWCDERLQQLNSRTSILNPLWYAGSFAMGAAAGMISDKISLGFVAATEEQVARHLEHHLRALPQQDEKSRAIVSTMLHDEREHGQAALQAGGKKLPKWIRQSMWYTAKLMTRTAYRI